MSGPPDKPLAGGDFYIVTGNEIWRAVTDLQSMAPDSSPLVRQVAENTRELAGLKVKVYLVIGALSTGLVLSTILRLTGVTPAGALRALGIG